MWSRGAMSSRMEATAARKEQIVRAGVALLADRGYKATTFDALAVVLVGSAHLIAAGSHPAPVALEDLRPLVSTALATVIHERQPRTAPV